MQSQSQAGNVAMQINVLLPIFAAFTCLEGALLFGVIYVKISRKTENLAFSFFCACIAWMIWYTLRLQELQDLSQALLVFRLQFVGTFLGMAALAHFAACITQHRLPGGAPPFLLYAAAILMAGMAFDPRVLHALPPDISLEQFRQNNEVATGRWFFLYAATPMCGTILACGLMLRSLHANRTIRAYAVVESASDAPRDNPAPRLKRRLRRQNREQTVSGGRAADAPQAQTASENLVFAPLSRGLGWIAASVGLIVLAGFIEFLDILDIPRGGMDWPVNPRSVAATIFCVVTGTILAKEMLLQERHKHRLVESNRQLYDLAQVRLQTTYDLQHQVKNKLAAIQWPLRNMQRGMRRRETMLPEELPGYEARVGAVLEEVDDMYDMLNTMLHIARMEAGFALNLGPKSVVDVAALTQYVGRKCAQAEREQQGEASYSTREFRITSELPCPTFLLYQTPLKQVLINLLDNAIKYSPRGAPIHVHAWEDASHLYIRIADEGKGLCAADLTRIFEEAFYRGRDGGGAASGTGIGLNLCKRLMEAQDGRIWAESDGEGKGSAFLLSLPCEYATNADISSA